jgi:hypothetical protein
MFVTNSNTQCLSGVLVAWRLSKSGGTGRILADGKNYFICRNFILSGVPVVGSLVEFEERPAQSGKLYPQAVNARIDNKKIIRSMEMRPQ